MILFIILLVGASFWLAKASNMPAKTLQPKQADMPESPAELAEMVSLPIRKWRADQIQLWRVGNALPNTQTPWQGQIGMNEERLAHISPPFQAQVLETGAHLGDEVAKNSVLAVLRSPEWVNMQRDQAQARAALNAAETVLTREKMLFDAKVSAKQDWLAALAARDQAKIALDAAHARAQSLQNAPSKTDQTGNYAIRAPIAGEIIEKHAIIGETVNPDTTLFVLADTRSVWAEFQIPVDQAGDLQVGHAIEIMDARAKTHAARIAHISRIGNAETRHIEAHAVLDNSTNQWQIGQFIQVRLAQTVPVSEAQIEIPSSALQNWDDQYYVFLKRDAHYLPHKIDIAAITNPARAVVLSGLAIGDEIVTEGSFLLKAELLKPSEEE